VLIISLAIPTAWYVMLIHMFYDMVANLVIVFSMGRRSGHRRPMGEPKSPRIGVVNREGTSDNTANNDQSKQTFQKGFTATLENGTTEIVNSYQPTTIVEASTYQENREGGKDHFVMVFQSGVYDDNADEDDEDSKPTSMNKISEEEKAVVDTDHA
jgi:hypothetical protein